MTDDLGFLTANPGSDDHEYYLSVISILFGEKKYQFISIPIHQRGKKVELLRVKQLSEMDCFQLSEEKEKELKRKYDEHFETLSEQERGIEKEALLQHLASEQSRIDVSYNKINAFTTIIVAVIPIAVTFVNRQVILSMNLPGKIIFGLLIYAAVNLCAWIFQVINVRGYMASRFSDLKESADKAKEWNWQIYYDWQQTRRKADMFVSFVIHTKHWIIAVIILTAIFSIGLPFHKKAAPYPDDNRVYTLQADSIEETYNKSAAEWYHILAQLQTDDYSKVLVLYSEADITEIAEELERFDRQEIIMITDDALEENQIKIILEK